MMRSLPITTATASSSLAAHPQQTLFKPNCSLAPPTSSLLPISLSLSKPTTPSSSQSSPSSTLAKTPPLLSSLLLNTSNNDDPGQNLADYAHVASKLVGDGRFEDFGMIVESVLNYGLFRPSEFGQLLNLKLVLGGIIKGLREGRIRSVVMEMLGGIGKLGIDVLGLFDGSAMELLKREYDRVLSDGNVEEAVQLLEILAGFEFPIRQLVEPNDMITICTNKRNPHVAVRYACLLPHAPILVCAAIKEFGKRHDLVSALAVFEASEKKLGGSNMYAYRTIIDVCGLCGNCFKSRSIYEDLLARKITPNIYVFNSLMNVNAHDLNYIMDVYKQMQNLGVMADMATYNILLKACCLAGRIDLAQDVYREVQQLESTGALKLDLFTYSTIIKVFADAKLWQMALKIKDDMLSAGVTPNTVTWSSLISACANTGLVDQATQLFEEMLLAGCDPNMHCFNTLLHACVEACQYDRAFRLFQTWKDSGVLTAHSKISKGDLSGPVGEDCRSMPYFATISHHLNFAKMTPFRPTTTTYNILMKACGSDYYRAKALMDEMKISGLFPNQISWSILIDLCGGTGNVEGALQILKSMREAGSRPDVVAYTTAIKVCVESKNLKIAFSLFAEMKRYRIQPNLVTYNTLLRARNIYGSLQEVQQCLAIYQDMRKAGYKSNDYYLKQLIEEWCEGVIQNNNQKAAQLNNEGADVRGPESLLLERVALHLQQSATESLVIDIQGLTKVEARIVVLAVLRMIKENHTSGHPIKDDLLIIQGVERVGGGTIVTDAIINLLRGELGLEVTSPRPSFSFGQKIDLESPSHLHRTSKLLPVSDSNTRRPAVLRRIMVTRKSLCRWLQRRSPAAS
ncbi:hypothetical protein Ancab_031968 [Ancistrocladus abbreviatus]